MSDEIRHEAQRRERERGKATERRRQFAADLRSVARTPAGRRILAWLLARGGIFAGEAPGEPAAAAFQAGRRSVALELWRAMRESLGREEFATVALGEAEETAETAEPEAEEE